MSSVQKFSKVDVKLPDDTSSPAITGAASMPNGKALFADFRNNKVKMSDNQFKVIDSYDLKSQPLSVVDRKTDIVILAYVKQLQYMQISPTLKPEHIR